MIRIPRRWTPEEALLMVAFLDAVVDAIWQLHGEGMVRWLQRHHGSEDITPAVHTSGLDSTPGSRPRPHQER